ncbi:DUF6496 domain-containing protein [Bdellovibrio reynosensis]|uniref:DUF6496 domain-containing protein n=1 Tax=Bdellovibrio reynosensis TaxID=2835041 RepID=A0ABY4C9P7_9BACT|nr:DUF6496 domain-containing protein [Bdellovibrio reynosensis]UOF00632.1 DUF6496 domain-containing protein [Bdellovibrio reynosensis]
MPDKKTVKRAQKAARQGKSASTQAGEFVREEIHKVRQGKHGVRNPQQAIAIGLSEARRAGVNIPEKAGQKKTAKKSKRIAQPKTSKTRAKATLNALKKEPTSTVSEKSLSKFTKKAAKKRSSQDRHRSAMKAVKTKGKHGLVRAAKKAAHTRSAHA